MAFAFIAEQEEDQAIGSCGSRSGLKSSSPRIKGLCANTATSPRRAPVSARIAENKDR